jgi:hypothetical protein
MVSLLYPNVNKHIFAETRSPVMYSKPHVEVKEQVELPRMQARMSAPPPYSKEDPVAVLSAFEARVSV